MRRGLQIFGGLLGVAILFLIFSFVLKSPEAEPERAEEKVATVSDDATPSPDIPSPARETTAAIPAVLVDRETATAEAKDSRSKLWGLVQNDKNEPVAKAKLKLFAKSDNSNWNWNWNADATPPSPISQVESGDDGRYEIESLDPSASYSLMVEATGYCPSSNDVRANQEKTITLYREAVLLGEIRDSTNRAPVVEVEVYFSNSPAKKYTTQTNEQGEYRLAGIAPYSRIELRVFKEGYAPIRRSVQLQGSGEKRVDLSLRRGVSIEGEVVDVEAGFAIADAEIYYFDRLVAKSDGTGRFKLLGVEETQATIEVNAANYAGLTRTLNADMLSSGQLIRFPVIRGVEIEGRVRSSGVNPAPIVGARLIASVMNEHGEGYGGASGRFMTFNGGGVNSGKSSNLPALPNGSWFQDSRRTRNQKSDESGHFKISGLIPSEQPYQVTATHSLYPAAQSQQVPLSRPAQTAMIEIEMFRGGSLEGTVTVEKKPINARVWVQARNFYSEAWTNDAGEYRFQNVPLGEVSVGASLGWQDWGQRQDPEKKVNIQSGQSARLDFELGQMTLRPIAGKVLNASGNPIPGIYVNAWAQVENRWVQRNTRSAADGSFKMEVPDLPGALYQVSTTGGSSSASKEKVAPGTENVELKLNDIAKLRLKVTDALSGDAVMSFSIRTSKAGTRANRWGGQSLSPDANGITEFDIAPGAYDVTVDAEALGFETLVLSNVNVTNDPNAPPVRAELQRGTRVEIQLVGESQAVPGGYHWYQVYSASGSRQYKYFEINDQGKGVLLGLTPGKYYVTVYPANIKLEPREVEIPRAEKFNLELKWKPVEEPK